MARDDRIAQLLALLEEARSNDDQDKIIEIESDLFREFKGLEMNQGGMMNINEMTRPVGYENGGNVITRRLASTRAEKPFEDFLKDIGDERFIKKDDKTGKIRGAKGNWAKYLTSKNIKGGSVEATNELNRLLKAAGKPLYVDIASAGKNFSEEIISAVTGTQPGESGARKARNKVNAEIKNLKTQGNKLHGANPSKAKNAFFKEALERMYPVLKNTVKGAAVLSATLTKTALGKALGPLDLLITTEMGSGELTPEMIEEFKKNQAQERMNKRGGGMMNINRMTAPLGYKEGGLLDKISDFFKYQRKDPERFFGGSDGMEFHLDDPSLIQFIKRKAGTDDEDSPEYQDELMRFMEEVSSFKKNQGGIMSMAGGGLLSSVGNLDTKVKKLELMEVLSLAEIDELDNMSASQIDKLYKEKFGK